MKPVMIFALIIGLTTLSCAGHSTNPAYMSSPQYQQREVVSESLFESDKNVLSNEDIEKILNARIVLPEKGRIAILRFGHYDRWNYAGAELADMNRSIEKNFIGKLTACKRVGDVSYLPSLLTPEKMTVPYLREGAARFQADLLLVYRSTSHSYPHYKVFSKDETRAYCVVEALLLDIRTGIVIFSSVTSEDYSAKKNADDMSFQETIDRAQQEAIGKALGSIAGDMVAFLEDVPVSNPQ